MAVTAYFPRRRRAGHARGLQSAFVNFSYFDEAFFHGMFDDFIFPDEKGTRPHWEAVSWLQKYFMQWFNKERLRTVLTFPVESFALVYQNGKFLEIFNEQSKFNHSLYFK